MSITNKQEGFCQEYIKDHNGTQSAIRAGYSPKTANEQAARLLTKVSIKERIGQLETKKAENIEYDRKESMRRKQVLLDALRARIANNDDQAIRTAHTILKQMDNINGLESITNINVDQQAPKPLSEQDRAELKELAAARDRKSKVKLA